MAKYTENYSFEQPQAEEFYSIDIHNDNMRLIDANLKKIADGLESSTLEEKAEEIKDGVDGLGEIMTQVQTDIGSLKENAESVKSDVGTVIANLESVKTDVGAVKASVDALKESIKPSGVKSVQRGTASGAGTVTIKAVNPDKSVVHSVSKGSAGYVAARGSVTGNLSLSNSSTKGTVDLTPSITSFATRGSGTYNQSGDIRNNYPSYSGSMTINLGGTITGTRTISGGTTDLTVKEYSAVLTNSTTLTTDGPCQWQVVEYY